MIEFDQDDRTAGAVMKSIRERAGLSIRELADLLRVKDIDGLRQMERGKRPISGPTRLVLEMIYDGRLNPLDELTAMVGPAD